MLAVDVQHRQGGFDLSCRFSSDARVTGLFGPSGAGKSTLLRIMAGLVKPDHGRVELAGRCVFDSARRLHVPAHRRRIGYVFQQARLFAHLNVRHNLAYGAWFAKRGANTDGARFARVTEMLDIGGLLERRVGGLSGGEQQRVAIGRALLADPAMLLLDEPLAALDAARKREVLPYIERMSAEIELPIVFVSHRLDELLRLARHRVVAIDGGRIAFAGATADFLACPQLPGAGPARATGALLRAQVASHRPDEGLSSLACGGQTLYVPRVRQPAGAAVTLYVSASDVVLARARPGNISALNVLAVRIQAIEAEHGYAVTVRLSVAEQTLLARITRRSANRMALAEGQSIYAVIKSIALAERAWQRLDDL